MKNTKEKSLKLEFEKFFTGEVVAQGFLMLNYPRKSTKNLHVTFKGSFKNNKLKLNENYLEDSKKIIRNWSFEKISDNLFLGSEKNVKGNITVNIEKKTLHMQYYFKLTVWKFNTTVFIKDFMYLVSKKEIINTTYISKFNINIAKVVLLYKKKS